MRDLTFSFNIRKFRNNTLLTTPSKDAQKRFCEKIHKTIEPTSVKQKSLIMMLNPIIKVGVIIINMVLLQMYSTEWIGKSSKKIWQWARRRHPQKCKGWVKDKYFRTLNGRSGDLRQIWARKIRLIISNWPIYQPSTMRNSSRFDIMPIRMTHQINRTTNGEKPTEWSKRWKAGNL